MCVGWYRETKDGEEEEEEVQRSTARKRKGGAEDRTEKSKKKRMLLRRKSERKGEMKGLTLSRLTAYGLGTRKRMKKKRKQPS